MSKFNKFQQELRPYKEQLELFASSICGMPVSVAEKTLRKRYDTGIILLPSISYPISSFFLDNNQFNIGNGFEYFLSLTAIQAGLYRYNQLDLEKQNLFESRLEQLGRVTIDSEKRAHAPYLLGMLEIGRIYRKLYESYPGLGEIIQKSLGQMISPSNFKNTINGDIRIHLMVDNEINFSDAIFLAYSCMFNTVNAEELNQNSDLFKTNDFFSSYKDRLFSKESTIFDSIEYLEELVKISRKAIYNFQVGGSMPLYSEMQHSQAVARIKNMMTCSQSLIDLLNLDGFIFYSKPLSGNYHILSEFYLGQTRENFVRVNPQSTTSGLEVVLKSEGDEIKRIEEKISGLKKQIIEFQDERRCKYHVDWDGKDYWREKKLKQAVNVVLREQKEIAISRDKRREEEPMLVLLDTDPEYIQGIIDQMRQIAPARRSKIRKCYSGTLDMRAYTRFQFARKFGAFEDPRFFFQTRKNLRDVSALLLLDASKSAGEVYDGKSVWQSICEESIYFSYAMNFLGDKFAIYAYNGHGQTNVNVWPLKSFDEQFDEEKLKIRLLSVIPRENNRDGAAIRFASQKLLEVPSKMRLLYHISDMKPRDVTLDIDNGHEIPEQKYIGRYALDDIIDALNFASQNLIQPIGICVAPKKRKNLESRVLNNIRSKVIVHTAQKVAQKIGIQACDIETELEQKFGQYCVLVRDLSNHSVFEALRKFYLRLTI